MNFYWCINLLICYSCFSYPLGPIFVRSQISKILSISSTFSMCLYGVFGFSLYLHSVYFQCDVIRCKKLLKCSKNLKSYLEFYAWYKLLLQTATLMVLNITKICGVPFTVVSKKIQRSLMCVLPSPLLTFGVTGR